MSSKIFSIADEIPPRSDKRVAGGKYLSAVLSSLDSPPLGFFAADEEDEAIASIRDVRDFRFTGEDEDGDDCRVLEVGFREGESSAPLFSAIPSC